MHVPNEGLGGAEGEELLRYLKDVPLRVLEVAPVLAGLGAALDLCHLLHPSRQKLSHRCANVFEVRSRSCGVRPPSLPQGRWQSSSRVPRA